MVYGYIRVSTDRQTVANQRYEIEQFCAREALSVDGWIEEKISGAEDYSKRKLGRLLGKIKRGDMIICAEMSRLGRNLFMIMEILNICMLKGCKVWTIKENYRLGNDLQSKIFAFALSLSAEIERDLIKQRTCEALKLRKQQGRHLGRPKGRGISAKKYKLYGKRKYIENALMKGVTKVKLCKRLGVSRETLRRYLKGLNKPIDNQSID